MGKYVKKKKKLKMLDCRTTARMQLMVLIIKLTIGGKE
jgi:hypothetical protein